MSARRSRGQPVELQFVVDDLRALGAEVDRRPYAGSAAAAAFAAATARDRAGRWLGWRVAAVGIAAAMGMGGWTMAAYAGVLPAPLQHFAHQIMRAPDRPAHRAPSPSPSPSLSPSPSAVPGRPGGDAGGPARRSGSRWYSERPVEDSRPKLRTREDGVTAPPSKRRSRPTVAPTPSRPAPTPSRPAPTRTVSSTTAPRARRDSVSSALGQGPSTRTPTHSANVVSTSSGGTLTAPSRWNSRARGL